MNLKILPENRKRAPHSSTYRWEDNIKMDPKIVRGLDSPSSDYGPMAGSCGHSDEHSGPIIIGRDFFTE
jgi:hypothetical protein